MAITPALTSQSVGTGANVGSDLFPTKVALAEGTTAGQVEALLVNGQAHYDERQDHLVRFMFSSLDVAAGAAPALFRQSARYVRLTNGREPLTQRANISLLEPAPAGGFFYMWVEAPQTDVASALTVNLVEYP